MRYCFTLLAAPLLLAQQVRADIKSDLLALTGNREVRAVWTRTVWCDSNCNPIRGQAGQSEKHTILMVLSTNEAAPRVLDPEGDHSSMEVFVTRKDASHAVWVDRSGKNAWIQAFDGRSAKRNLNLGTDFEVLSCHYNPATGQENLFVRSADLTTVYRIPLTSSYAADLAAKTQVIFQQEFEGNGGTVDDAFSVSGDGKMAGCALPWPNTRIVEIATKTVYGRHTGMFGCNCQIAPDNSYRFWQFHDYHDRLNFWGASLSENMVEVPLTNALPGSTINGPVSGSDSDTAPWMDCGDPRFTSDPRFMTLVYPGPYGGDHLFADGAVLERAYQNGEYDLDAAHVKQLPVSRVQHFCLGKFNADFTAVQEVLIAGGDVRVREGDHGGMAWIGQTASAARKGGVGTLRASPQGWPGIRSAIRIMDARGRIVVQYDCKGMATVSTRSLAKGIYFVDATQGSRRTSPCLTVSK